MIVGVSVTVMTGLWLGNLLDQHQQRHQAQLLRGRGDRDSGAPGPDHVPAGLHPAEQPPLPRQQNGQHDDW